MIKRVLFLSLTTFLACGFSFEEEEPVFHYYIPEFGGSLFYDGDSVRYVQFFDEKKSRIYDEYKNQLEGVDSCAVFILNNVECGCISSDLFDGDTTKRCIATYKRLSSDKWLRHRSGKTEIVTEMRSRILFTGYVQQESPVNPGTVIHHYRHFYEVDPR